MAHSFLGKWITTAELAAIPPRNVFHRQLEKVTLPDDGVKNRHVLFRRRFTLGGFARALLYISADDYYKLYINGVFVGQGPSPAYHFRYGYNVIDVSAYLVTGENVIAVHTLYQGLINRVWQSGDGRHGLILDLVADGKTVLASDPSFRTSLHTAFEAMGKVGYETQFLERYDAAAPEVGFERTDFDDGDWHAACVKENDDHTLVEQKSKMLDFECVLPKVVTQKGERVFIDFGANHVGYLSDCQGSKG